MEILMALSLRFKLIFKALGTGVCVILIVGSWLSMAEVLQGFQEKYENQFCQVYIVRSFSSLLYVAWKLWIEFPGEFSCNYAGVGTLLNFKKLLIATFCLSCFIFGSDVLWYISLTMTRISANTAIFQSAPALVFLMSIPMLRERVTLTKILSVALTVVGVCLVSLYPTNILDDDEQRSNTTGTFEDNNDEEYEHPLGYVYLVIAVILYALYETFYKKFAAREDDTAPIWNVVRVLGYSGVITLFLFWPTIVIAHFSGLETFAFPPTWEIFYELLVVCALDLIFHIALLICISVSSPLFASVASILTIPVAVFLDWWLRDFILSWQALVGVGGVLLGFAGLTVSEIREKIAKGIEDKERLIHNEDKDPSETKTQHKYTFLSKKILHIIV